MAGEGRKAYALPFSSWFYAPVVYLSQISYPIIDRNYKKSGATTATTFKREGVMAIFGDR